jgi:hypothetical protein
MPNRAVETEMSGFGGGCKTLMNRGQKGCYVSSVEPTTNAYINEVAGRQEKGSEILFRQETTK